MGYMIGIFRTTLIASCFCIPVVIHAQDSEPSKLKLSGFVSLVDGKILNSNFDPASNTIPNPLNGIACPCFIADWGNAGVYGSGYSFAPESRGGIQANYTINDRASLVGQLVVRGTDGTPDLTWAYGSYKIDRNWEVQVGRKRIPLYYYSDFQDIGISYPWISPPPELYGWEVTNYSGGSLRFRTDLGDTSIAASAFAGRESLNTSKYNSLVYSGTTSVAWNNMGGADLEINNGPATVRVVYVTANTSASNPSAGLDQTAGLKAYGIAANFDFDSWFVLSEITRTQRSYTTGPYANSIETSPAVTIGAGVRLGKWTPFINYAEFMDQTDNLAIYQPQSYKRTSLTLRYDLDSSSAMKTQLDRNTDITNNNGGDATVFRVSYDRIF